ncbi:MAG: cysteine desulfurase [Acidobacteriota bacterium]|nr:cysteine desulfurase [Acidobacteriota bacterium]
MKEVYFDHNATTPIDPRVLEAMLPWLGALHGNPSSVHSFGQRSREAVEKARAEVAALLEIAEPTQVVFTSSGTEANNAVVLGAARSAGQGGRLVISAIEHPSIEASAVRLEEAGVEVVRVKPRSDGCVEPEAIESVLDERTFLVCLMLANNELGTLQPVREVAEGCRARGVPLLCDAVQAVGKIPVSAPELGVDYLVLGGHKFNAPAGAAAVWVRPGAVFEGFHLGGGQERNRRAGTENVAALVGLGAAAALAASEVGERGRRMAKLRDRFEGGLEGFADVVVHGAQAKRLPNTSHVALVGVSAESLMIRLDLDGFAVSAGAACSSGKVEPSRVLLALGVGELEALSSVRVSFGQGNDERQVDDLLGALGRHVGELRRLSVENTSGTRTD